MKKTALALLLIATGCNGTSTKVPIEPPKAAQTISLKGKTFLVRWMGSDPDRRYAVSDLTALGDGEATLAAWDRDRILHFFARTGVVFDVAFLSADRKVLEIGDVKGDVGVTSRVEARAALFVAAGWLKTNGVAAGDRVDFSAELAGKKVDPMPEIRVGGKTVHVETSHKREQRMRGLMNRTTMSANDGMLFMYSGEDSRSFWMMNCHYGLDIAFFGADRRLQNVVPIDPYPDPNQDPGENAPGGRARSKGGACFVLEVPKGWFKKAGLVDDDGMPVKPVTLELSAPLQKLADEAD